ncbi:hypothetical protein WME90_43915 [Sorangium sp. So ce375]|uniref:hypothetical protein n=1 Tax=Sorangium sp. So ce375 TaxID=3133306 RepID=UPI003F5C5617
MKARRFFVFKTLEPHAGACEQHTFEASDLGHGLRPFLHRLRTQWWQFLFLPFHWTMGPLHGAIVNWFGHRYGYRDFKSDDDSRATLVLDIVTLGELFQSNHHKHSMSPNWACAGSRSSRLIRSSACSSGGASSRCPGRAPGRPPAARGHACRGVHSRLWPRGFP